MNKIFVVVAALCVAGGALVTAELTAQDSKISLSAANAEPRGGSTPLTTTLVTSGLVRPIFVTYAPGDFTRIFIIEKQGRIRIYKFGVGLLPTPFLDIDPIVVGGTSANDERGLLGLAFHPDYNTPGRPGTGVFYCYYTREAAGNNEISKFTVSANPDVANNPGASPDIIFTRPDSFTNHNGGYLAFGPNDGYLYISMGDGGSACDPNQRAQNLNDYFGKIHRIDVNSDAFPGDPNMDYAIPPTNPFAAGGGLGEIWLFGMRNPWRATHDRLTGDLYVADVGQSVSEEVDFRPFGSAGSRNYGWDCMEGTHCSSESPSSCSPSACVCGAAGLVAPVFEYSHALSRCSITGGSVYRGCAIPDLQGVYFFADFCGNQIYSLRMSGGVATNFTDRTAELAPGGGLNITAITSFGEDAFGEIYICDQTGGEVFKIVPRTLVGPDCNANGRNDACDILSGSSLDANHNSVPDECDPPPCPQDLTGDGMVGAADLAALLGSWGIVGGPADFDGGGTGSSDLAQLLGAWGSCP